MGTGDSQGHNHLEVEKGSKEAMILEIIIKKVRTETVELRVGAF